MMMYPFYVKMKVISLKVWPTSLLFVSTRLAQGELYIGDSEGRLRRLNIEASDVARGLRNARILKSTQMTMTIDVINMLDH
jgi:hypothetical protein